MSQVPQSSLGRYIVYRRRFAPHPPAEPPPPRPAAEAPAVVAPPAADPVAAEADAIPAAPPVMPAYLVAWRSQVIMPLKKVATAKFDRPEARKAAVEIIAASSTLMFQVRDRAGIMGVEVLARRIDDLLKALDKVTTTLKLKDSR